ncbi:MAG: YfhO family protein [Vulcanimicrobiota bacterium]
MPTRREFALAALGALALVVFFFFPALLGKLVYSGDLTGSDLFDLNLPRRALVADAYRQGHLPHWTSLLGNGFPLLAEGQSGPFYPPNLVYLALPPGPATNLAIMFTVWLALFSTYLLARRLTLDPPAAAISAVAFGLGPTLLIRLKHLNMIQVSAWLPLSLYCIESWLADRHPRWLLAAAAVWALQLLAGHPHMTCICLLASLLYALARAIALGLDLPTLARAFGLFSLAGLAALLLAAAQLQPTWRLVGQVERGQALSWQAATDFPLNPADLPGYLLYPFWRGNPATASWPLEGLAEHGLFWENLCYIGLAPLLLVFLSPRFEDKRQLASMAGLALVLLLLALGRYGGLYWLVYKLVPGFSLFRLASRFVGPLTLALALLAGLGAQKVPTRVALLLLLFTVGDLYHLHRSYNVFVEADWLTPATPIALAPQDRLAHPTAEQTWQLAYLKAGGWRGRPDYLRAVRASLAPDSSALYGAKVTTDKAILEGGLVLAPQAALQRAIRQGVSSQGEQAVVSEAAQRLMRAEAVTRIVSFLPLTGDLPSPQVHQVHPELPPLLVYALPDPLPRARLITGHRSAPLPDQLALLADPDHDPATQVLLADGQNANTSGETGTVEWLEDGELSQRLRVQAPAEGYLVVSDNWHPDWQATVDGQPAPVLRADFAFRAVAVPAGQHEVTFRFQPAGFGLALMLSGLAWLALAGYLAGQISTWATRPALVRKPSPSAV